MFIDALQVVALFIYLAGSWYNTPQTVALGGVAVLFAMGVALWGEEKERAQKIESLAYGGILLLTLFDRVFGGFFLTGAQAIAGLLVFGNGWTLISPVGQALSWLAGLVRSVLGKD